jgi:hypothetical protein
MAQRTNRGTSTIIAPQNNSSQPEQDNRILSISDWLARAVVLPTLKDGQYQVQLLSFEPVTVDPDPSKHYIRLVWQFPDRTVTDNRFLTGIQVMASQIADIAPATAGMRAPELFSFLQRTSLPCWVSHNTTADGRTFRNLNFRAPAVTTAVEDITPENF